MNEIDLLRGVISLLKLWRINTSAPENQTLPVLTNGGQGSGNLAHPHLTDILSSTDGTWSGSPTSYTYQWTRDGVNIGGETNATYTVQIADVDSVLACVVTAHNVHGTTPQSSLPTGTVVFSPLTGIPGLARLMDYRSPYPQKSAVSSGDPAGNGDEVIRCADQYQPGPTQYDDQITGIAPHMHTTGNLGLDFGEASDVQYLRLYNNVVQGGLTAYTMWIVGYYTGGDWFPLGCVNPLAAITVSAGTVTIYDNGGAASANILTLANGLVLIELDMSSGGALQFAATGIGNAGNIGGGFGESAFEAVGAAPGYTLFNSDPDSRHLFQCIASQQHVYASSVRTQMRAWIAANLGATL